MRDVFFGTDKVGLVVISCSISIALSALVYSAVLKRAIV